MALNSIKLHFSQVYNISLNPIKRMKKKHLVSVKFRYVFKPHQTDEKYILFQSS